MFPADVWYLHFKRLFVNIHYLVYVNRRLEVADQRSYEFDARACRILVFIVRLKKKRHLTARLNVASEMVPFDFRITKELDYDVRQFCQIWLVLLLSSDEWEKIVWLVDSDRRSVSTHQYELQRHSKITEIRFYWSPLETSLLLTKELYANN